ncbi:hypothetical protein BDP27DRAFT_1040158 [Rhodocollybia butyracea]|uniref:Uncharacterized protein n=1 Tax=Rhodocollybia butyracea TaxID=206335 RepID=A0A9P5Q8D0_9AGAR|nr:hypothetical protein BDP27DRAFT_1040158 [Rhodocollybia butyracea]
MGRFVHGHRYPSSSPSSSSLSSSLSPSSRTSPRDADESDGTGTETEMRTKAMKKNNGQNKPKNMEKKKKKLRRTSLSSGSASSSSSSSSFKKRRRLSSSSSDREPPSTSVSTSGIGRKVAATLQLFKETDKEPENEDVPHVDLVGLNDLGLDLVVEHHARSSSISSGHPEVAGAKFEFVKRSEWRRERDRKEVSVLIHFYKPISDLL